MIPLYDRLIFFVSFTLYFYFLLVSLFLLDDVARRNIFVSIANFCCVYVFISEMEKNELIYIFFENVELFYFLLLAYFPNYKSLDVLNQRIQQNSKYICTFRYIFLFIFKNKYKK